MHSSFAPAVSVLEAAWCCTVGFALCWMLLLETLSASQPRPNLPLQARTEGAAAAAAARTGGHQWRGCRVQGYSSAAVAAAVHQVRALLPLGRPADDARGAVEARAALGGVTRAGIRPAQGDRARVPPAVALRARARGRGSLSTASRGVGRRGAGPAAHHHGTCARGHRRG